MPDIDSIVLSLGPAVKHVKRKYDGVSVVVVAFSGTYSNSLAAQCLLARQRTEEALRKAGFKAAVDVMAYELIGHGLCAGELKQGDPCLIGARYTLA